MRAPPRAPVALPAFSCRATCFSALLLLVEIVSTPVYFVLYHLASVYGDVFVVSGIMSLMSIVCGGLGMMRWTPAVVTSLMVSVATSFLGTILGGLCIIFSQHLSSPVTNFLDKELIPVTAEGKVKLVRDTQSYLSIAAVVLLGGAFLHLVFGRYLYSLLGNRRGSTAFLQVFSIIILPFSMFLVIGGQYIVDTGTLASAPYTGVIIFGVGALMLMLAMLAFVGSSFEYRRLLSICCLLSFIVGTCVVGISIAYYAMRDGIQSHLVENWELIRVILPPTYQAQYDRDQFSSFMETNLKMAAFVGIISGLFLLLEAAVCMTLMHYSTLFKRQLAQDKENMKHVQAATSSPSGTKVDHVPHHVHARRQWALHFEASKRRQRIGMRVVALVFVLGVAFIFSVLCANVVFVAKCSSIGKLVQAFTDSMSENSNATVANRIQVTNRFTRGAVVVTPSSNAPAGQMLLDIYGSKGEGKKASDFYQKTFADELVSFMVNPIDVTRFLWIDGSCQRSTMTLGIPDDALRTVDIATNASVEVNTNETSDQILSLRGIKVATGQSNIKYSDVTAMEDGMSLQSYSGQITAQDFVVDGKNSSGFDTKAEIYSELGQVDVQNASLVACDLQVASGAGTIFITNAESIATTGRSQIQIQSTSGSISATNVRANWIDIRTEQGDVFGSSIITEGNTAFMGRFEVTTISGDITLQQIDASGNVHVESSSGSIQVQLSSLTFVGMYYMRSERGTMTIRRGKYATDNLTELPDSSDGFEKHGAINCKTNDRSCLSYGDLHLRTQYGNIEIVLGCDTFQCN